MDMAAGPQLPDMDGATSVARDGQTSIRGHRERVKAPVCSQRVQLAAAFDLPDLRGAVI